MVAASRITGQWIGWFGCRKPITESILLTFSHSKAVSSVIGFGCARRACSCESDPELCCQQEFSVTDRRATWTAIT